MVNALRAFRHRFRVYCADSVAPNIQNSRFVTPHKLGSYESQDHSQGHTRTWESLAVVLPYRMLYMMVSLNSTVSWGTTAMAARTLPWVQRLTSCPSISTAPD